ncbi:MAG: hypothetical protein KatS3mg052_1361 [Candidatus Roseilinea sp.]|nr:MAG: hypothetical protein KatS3mg052_1361 [Candidatus Roseilinea sp.]
MLSRRRKMSYARDAARDYGGHFEHIESVVRRQT